MRPLSESKPQRRVHLLRGLRNLSYDCLAQRESIKDTPYSGGEYRMILNTFDRLLAKLIPLDLQRRRLRHLVVRIENWVEALDRPDARDLESQALSQEAALETAKNLAIKAKSKRVKNLRPFAPYAEALQQRKLEREYNNRVDRLPCPPGTENPWTLNYKESAGSVAMGYIHTEVQPLRLDFSVADERRVNLLMIDGYLCDSGQRIRYLLASTGLVLPGVTFCGTSTRLEETVGLMLKNEERGSFRALSRAYFPVPTEDEIGSDRRLESVACRPAFETAWPHPILSARQHIALQLLKFASQHWEELVSREVLLTGVSRPTVPSKALKELAQNYLRQGRTIPRTSFLEMSLHLTDSADTSTLKMEPEGKDMPSYVIAARCPLNEEQRLQVIHLAITVLGDSDNEFRIRVQSLLSRKLRERLKRLRTSLPSECLEFEDFCKHLEESKLWTESLGSLQFPETTIWVLLERLVAQAEHKVAQGLTEGLDHLLCQNMMREDADWFLLSVLLSHLQERGTAWKMRRLAKTDSVRLARLMEDFYLQPDPKFYLPLEKLAIFCESQGELGEAFRDRLARFLPVLPSVRFSPGDATKIQAEMLRRSRWWTQADFRPEVLCQDRRYPLY